MMSMGIASIQRSTRNSQPDPKTINTGIFTEGDNKVDYYGRVGKIYELTFKPKTYYEWKEIIK